MEKLEHIKFFDSELNKTIEVRYQDTNKFGILVLRLDNYDIQYIKEEDIIESNLIDKEFENFRKSSNLNNLYRSHYDYLSKLKEETVDFLINNCRIDFQILERNWYHSFDNLEHVQKVKDGTNKWGNSAAINILKTKISLDAYADLKRLFNVCDYDTYYFVIYNIFLALEILSKRLNDIKIT